MFFYRFLKRTVLVEFGINGQSDIKRKFLTITKSVFGSGELVYSIKVNVNPQCFERMIFLGPQQKHTVAFDYKLNEIYPNLKPGEYLLHFKYQGTIENLKGEEIDLTEPILSDRIRASI